jgi:hypothetical protein
LQVLGYGMSVLHQKGDGLRAQFVFLWREKKKKRKGEKKKLILTIGWINSRGNTLSSKYASTAFGFFFLVERYG